MEEIEVTGTARQFIGEYGYNPTMADVLKFGEDYDIKFGDMMGALYPYFGIEATFKYIGPSQGIEL